MVITTLLLYVVARERWRWPLPVAVLLAAFFLLIDLAFFGANIVKVPQGGWFPLLVAGLVFTLMTTWKRGRYILTQRLKADALPAESFVRGLEDKPQIRVLGTAVFMNSHPENTPPALLNNLKHNKILHRRVVFLSVRTAETPRVPEAERAQVTPFGEGVYRVVLHYGFMEKASVPEALAHLSLDGVGFKPSETTYFLGRETLLTTGNPDMASWREKLFAFMARNGAGAVSFFGLPPDRVIELGTQVEL